MEKKLAIKLIEKALSAQHDKKVSIVTKLGKKDKGLMELCRVNTEYVLRQEKQNENYSLRLKKLGESLKISSSIEWIESFDISHHSGKNAVAGCVVYSSNGKEKSIIVPIILAKKMQVMTLDQ